MHTPPAASHPPHTYTYTGTKGEETDLVLHRFVDAVTKNAKELGYVLFTTHTAQTPYATVRPSVRSRACMCVQSG